MSTILGSGHKGKIAYDATTGLPNGVTEAAAATYVDGVLDPLTSLASPDSFITGGPKTVSTVVKVLLGAVAQAKFVNGTFVPFRRGI